jgi:phosphoglycolate phosphatase
LFDFDGTLGDSYPAITASVNHVRAGYALTPLTVAQVLPHVGRGPAALLDATVGQGSSEANVAAYREHHPSVMIQGTTLLPGVEAALKLLHARGLLLGLCSNKPVAFTTALVAHLQIATYFRVVLGPENVAHPKPAPDMLLEAMRRLAVAPAETLYIGDMVVDIQTARAAGVRVWVVPTGSDTADTLSAAHPDRLLISMHDLVTHLDAAVPI